MTDHSWETGTPGMNGDSQEKDTPGIDGASCKTDLPGVTGRPAKLADFVSGANQMHFLV